MWYQDQRSKAYFPRLLDLTTASHLDQSLGLASVTQAPHTPDPCNPSCLGSYLLGLFEVLSYLSAATWNKFRSVKS